MQAAVDRCNRTELYQLCLKRGLKPPLYWGKASLAALFLGVINENDIETYDRVREVDTWREGLKGFVQKNWTVLQPQLTCPIRDDIDACKRCLDAQVVCCVVEQREHEHLIQIHRK